jgi:membrane protein YdbS with pleckstrin-like domain/DNA-directed RNA polymerase subunit RPC12/RpoP
MNTIKYECPRCHEIIAGDESRYGQQVNCPKCQAAMLIPQTPADAPLPTARLVQESAAAAPGVMDEPGQETDVFDLSPVARAFAGQLVLGAMFLGLGLFFAMGALKHSWPRWVALIPCALGLLLLLLVWIKTKSHRYRLTSQRLFVYQGWVARDVNELELYRVEDVRVDQGILQRLLGYGTITVVANDNTTPQVDLIGIAKPMEVKETIRTQYRAARKREGVRPTEFLQSPGSTPAPQRPQE